MSSYCDFWLGNAWLEKAVFTEGWHSAEGKNHGMKARIGFGLVTAALLLATGCSGIGPGRITRDRFDYTSAILQSWKSEILLNMVKLRYGNSPVFLDVVSVINSYEVSGVTTLGANWKFHPSYESGANLGASGFYADRPTITSVLMFAILQLAKGNRISGTLKSDL